MQMKASALPKSMLLTKSWQYGQVYAQGARLRGQDFSLICLPNNRECCRLGISVHGVRLAVHRNRIKRLIREFFRLNPMFVNPPADVVFAVRPGFAFDALREIDLAVQGVLARNAAREKHGTSGVRSREGA